MKKKMNSGSKLKVIPLGGLEQTMIAGKSYILVTDTEEGDGEALILRDLSRPEDTEGIYEEVTDDAELAAIAEVFGNILEDVELIDGDFE